MKTAQTEAEKLDFNVKLSRNYQNVNKYFRFFIYRNDICSKQTTIKVIPRFKGSVEVP